MKNLKQIKSTLKDYEEIISLAKEKIKILEEIYPSMFNTAKGIEDINFYDETVHVTCDDSCRGCYDSTSFKFPLNYLTLSDNDLRYVVEKLKNNILNKKIQDDINKSKIEEEKKEKIELDLFKRLKEKYEGNN